MTKAARIRSWPKDDEGAILVFWAVALCAILGIVALSFDFGQKAATQSELQSFADQVALAAAGELDGKADAITRATAAAANLIADSQTFATGAHALSHGLGLGCHRHGNQCCGANREALHVVLLGKLSCASPTRDN